MDSLLFEKRRLFSDDILTGAQVTFFKGYEMMSD